MTALMLTDRQISIFFFFILTCLDWKEFINQFKGNVILRTSDITPDQFYEWNKKQDLNLKDFNLSLTISTPPPPHPPYVGKFPSSLYSF